MYLIYQLRLPIVIGELEWCLMACEIINSPIILSILFSLARWATIKMPSNSPPKFPITPGEKATAMLNAHPVIHNANTPKVHHLTTMRTNRLQKAGVGSLETTLYSLQPAASICFQDWGIGAKLNKHM